MTDQPPSEADRREADRHDEPPPHEDQPVTPPHPSPAEGGSTEEAERPPRPSQAEGER